MQQLLDEVSLASHQLVQVQQLAAECKTLRDTPVGRSNGRGNGGLSKQTEGDDTQSRLMTDGDIPSQQMVEGGALSPGEEALSRGQTPQSTALLVLFVLPSLHAFSGLRISSSSFICCK